MPKTVFIASTGRRWILPLKVSPPMAGQTMPDNYTILDANNDTVTTFGQWDREVARKDAERFVAFWNRLQLV